MTSKTSSRGNWIVYTSALSRLKWFSILYGLLLGLGTPLMLWMELARQKFFQETQFIDGAFQVYNVNVLFNPVISLMNILHLWFLV